MGGQISPHDPLSSITINLKGVMGEICSPNQNIYATDQFPNSVFIWKNGLFVKINKNKAIDLIIKNKLDTLSEYIDTKENIDDEILDKYLDYREQMEENVIFHKQSVEKISDTLINIGNQISTTEIH